MAILITQARFTPDGTTAAPEDRVEAARRLVARAGGTLLAAYLTSGDYDILFFFEAPSYEAAVAALADAGESGMADVKTVRVLTSSGLKRAAGKAASAAADHRSAGAGVAELPSTEPASDPPKPDPQREETTGETQADAEAARRILDARKKAVEDIAAGRPAPYYLVPPATAAPSKAAPAPPVDNEDAAKEKSPAGDVSPERIRKG